MGLIRWFKKELDVRRRQSAPPLSMKMYETEDESSENQNSQLKSLAIFHEWRTNQRMLSLSKQEYNQNTTIESLNDRTTSQSIATATVHPAHITEIIIPPDTYNGNDNDQQANRKGIRYPMSYKMTDNRKNKRPAPPVPTRDIIYEEAVKQFENEHCKNISEFNVLNSPPREFYRLNTSVYSDKKREDNRQILKETTPSKQETINRSLLNPIHTQQPNDRHKTSKSAPTLTTGIPRYSEILKRRTTATPTKVVRTPSFNGLYQKYNISSSSASDGATIAQPSRHKIKKLKSSNRNSPDYQIVINKHGDLVEYAIPYCDQFAMINGDNTAKETKSQQIDLMECNDVINENFKFLNGTAGNKTIEDENLTIHSLESSLLNRRIDDVMVTDLDKSFEGHFLNEQNQMTKDRQGYMELNSLEKWSENIVPVGIFGDKDVCESPKLNSESEIIICSTSEIKPKTSVLQSTISTPMDFMSGIFRKNSVTLYSGGAKKKYSFYVDMATKRNFKILRQIRHSDIIILMATALHDDLQEMTLIMEPTDYTLNYFLYQMDEKLSIFQCISVTEQIANAIRYLHECGYIHSNVSSHCILMRNGPACVKLTAFELTTSVSRAIKCDIEERFGQRATGLQSPVLKREYRHSLLMKNGQKHLIERYQRMSKSGTIRRRNRFERKGVPIKKKLTTMSTRFLPYNVAYRQQFSVHYYQAPELLVDERTEFVFPTLTADSYALTLLLWELLNRCVPFVIFDETELRHLYQMKQAYLPIFEPKRCGLFRNIFDGGLEIDQHSRRMTIARLIEQLQEVKFDLNSSKLEIDPQDEQIDLLNQSEHMRKLEEMNSKSYHSVSKKNDDKKYFNSSRTYENMSNFTMPGEISMTKDEQVKNVNSDYQPERRPKKKKLAVGSSALNLTDDFNKFLTPKMTNSKSVGRTSTIKRKTDMRRTTTPTRKSTVRGLFDSLPDNQSLNDVVIIKESELPSKQFIERKNTNDEFIDILNRSKTNDEIDRTPKQIYQPSVISRSAPGSYRFEIEEFTLPNTPIARQNKIRRNAWLSDQRELPNGSSRIVHKPINNCNVTPVAPPKPLRRRPLNVSIRIVHNKMSPPPNDNNAENDAESPSVSQRIQYFNSIERSNHDLPSVQRSLSASQVDRSPQLDQISPDDSDRESRHELVKQIHDLSTEISRCLTNNCFTNILPEIKEKLVKDLTETDVRSDSLPITINNFVTDPIKSPPIVIEEHHKLDRNGHFEQILWRREKTKCDRDDPLQKRPSVRESIRRFEQEVAVIAPIKKIENKLLDEKISNFQATVNQMLQVQDANNGIAIIQPRDGGISTNSSTSISAESNLNRLTSEDEEEPTVEDSKNESIKVLIANTPSDSKKKQDQLESTKSCGQTVIKRTIFQETIVSGLDINPSQINNGVFEAAQSKASLSGKQLTTCVTLNLRNISRRSSDVGLKSTRNSPITERHSICTTGTADQQLRVTAGTNDHRDKYVCCNCMASLNADQMRSLIWDNLGRPSIGGIVDQRYLSLMRRQPTITATGKSIEDLYIDDDFMEQRYDLAANMELMEANDEFDPFEFD